MDNRQSELRATSVAIVLLAVVFVVLRFISRRMNGIRIGSDDIMIYTALASSAYCSCFPVKRELTTSSSFSS